MAVWSLRCAGYKIGVLLLFLGSILYLIGFASPFWFKVGRSYSGLWMGCHEGLYETTCRALGTDTVAWFKATQGLECLGLIGIFISCTYAFVVNCCQTSPAHSRFLEVMAGFSGLAGFVANMVFVGKTDDFRREFYSWAFGLNLTGSILIVIITIILCITNRPLDTNSSGTVIYAGQPPVQGGNMVVLQQGQGYPPQPGYGYPQGGQPQYSGFVPAGAPVQAGYPPQGYSGQTYTQGYSGQEFSSQQNK